MDRLNNAIKVLKHLIVRETEDYESLCLDIVLAVFVVRVSTVVALAIDFDGDLWVKAYEVDDILANRVLPTELEPCKLLCPERPPECLLRPRGIAA